MKRLNDQMPHGEAENGPSGSAECFPTMTGLDGMRGRMPSTGSMPSPPHLTCGGTRLSDVLAIGLGWGVLAAAIFYPGLQLLAIVVGIAFFSMRSFARLVLGSPRRGRELAVFAPVSSNFMRAA